MNDNIKQDINFLEYPLWMQSAQVASDTVVRWEDRDGYHFEASRGVPSKVDMLFLYYIMLESQNNNWNTVVSCSRYKILNACGMSPSKEKRDRLIRSLEAWKRVTVSFSGTFYTGTGYKFLEFGIINDWGVREKDNYLEIELNKKWIEKIKQSEFFKYLSFEHMKRLRSPLALRLYEILVKTFYKRDVWEIDVLKLAEKIPMAEKYFADVVPKIEAATKRIKEKTELNITVKVIKHSRGQGKFIFTKKEKKGKPEAKESSCELLSLPEPPQSVLKTPQPQLKLPPPSEPPP
ncbi:MAG: replication initiator protein A, partial [Alphaproteobacteria bacterium]